MAICSPLANRSAETEKKYMTNHKYDSRCTDTLAASVRASVRNQARAHRGSVMAHGQNWRSLLLGLICLSLLAGSIGAVPSAGAAPVAGAGKPGAAGTANEPLSVLPAPDLTQTPRFQIAHVQPGAALTYHYVLRNNTNATLNVTFQATSDSGWAVSVNPSTASVPPAGNQPVDAVVQVGSASEPSSARVLLTATAGPASATGALALWTTPQPLSDLDPANWAYDYVQFLMAQSALSGYADGSFHPAAPVTRAQIAKMLTIGMHWPLIQPAQPAFSDVPAASWAYPYIETAVQHGILTGYQDGTFRPNSNVTRAQLAKLLVLARGWTPLNPPSARFSDVGPSDWAYQFVETAADTGAVAGYADGTFQPGAPASRAQVAKILATGLLVGENYRSQPIPPPVPPEAQVYWGAYIKGSTYGYDDPPWDWRSVDAFESHTQKATSIIHWGDPWIYHGTWQPFDYNAFDTVRQHGRIPMINWNSWDPCCGGTQPAFSLGSIINGTYDSYIRQWATDARNWGHPFFLRFDDEMNGHWYPWSEQINGNQPGQFVAMWRHVHAIFTEVGATNVTWVWCPNSEFDGSLPLESLYPGDSYVDWVGVDAYNWGTNPAKPDVWLPFSQVFAPIYTHLGTLAPSKPIMIAETASTEYGGSKAAWITDGLTTQLPQTFPRVKAFVWFNWNSDGEDWTIETSPAAQAAFSAGIALPYYAANTFATLPAGPIAPLGSWPVR